MMPVSLWTDSPGVAGDFCVWVSLAHVRAPGANKMSFRTHACVFLGFPLDASDWVFYDPVTYQFSASHNVRFGESVCYYRSRPHQDVSHVTPHSSPPSVSEIPPHSSLRSVATEPVGVLAGCTGRPDGVCGGGAGFGGAGAGGIDTVAPTPRTVRFLTCEQRLLRLEREERDRFKRAR
ncbi:unnamed protein product [Closterium sp. NIES-53]